MFEIGKATYVYGSAIRKEETYASDNCCIVPFPESRRYRESRLGRILDSSEMACSLRYEDARGCRVEQATGKDQLFAVLAAVALLAVMLVLGI